MFITNIKDLEDFISNCYICDKPMSDYLIKHGFSLFSAIYEEDKYYFIKTNKLIAFIEKGGEDDE